MAHFSTRFSHQDVRYSAIGDPDVIFPCFPQSGGSMLHELLLVRCFPASYRPVFDQILPAREDRKPAYPPGFYPRSTVFVMVHHHYGFVFFLYYALWLKATPSNNTSITVTAIATYRYHATRSGSSSSHNRLSALLRC
jgi:hypothetical protein